MTLRVPFGMVLALAIIMLGSLGCSDNADETVNSGPDDGVTAELVAHWSFDEGAGTEADDQSISKNTASVNGASWTSGAVGGALEFDGQDDFVVIRDDSLALGPRLAGLGAGSISLWFRSDTDPPLRGMAPIFYYGAADSCDFSFDASNQGIMIEIGHGTVHANSKRLYFTIFGNGCTGPSFCFDTRDPVTTGEWHHFVAVVGPDFNTGYFDGVEMTWRRYNFGDESSSQFLEDAVEHSMLAIGKGFWSGGQPNFFDGAIDDVRIYDGPLTGDEVAKLYGMGLPE